MSNPHYGGQFGQPGNTGQFQGQVPQPSQQFQGQMPQQTGFNGQMPGQMPQAPRKKNNKATALIAVIVAAVLVIIGGGAFALTRSLSASGGFASPNALANSINSAFGSNKLTSLATALSPSELKAATTWQKDYKANGKADWSKLVSPETLADYIGQIDLSKSTIEYTVDEKSENLSLITITKWEGEVTIKPELVDKIRQNYEKAKGEKLTANESSMLDDMKSSLSKESTFSGNILGQLDLDTLTIVSVKENGKWYISPAMTMAEQMYPTSSIRPNYDADFTDVKGASSAEEPSLAWLTPCVTALAWVTRTSTATLTCPSAALPRSTEALAPARTRTSAQVFRCTGSDLHDGHRRRDRRLRYDVHHLRRRLQGRFQQRHGYRQFPRIQLQLRLVQQEHEQPVSEPDCSLHGGSGQPRVPRCVHGEGQDRLARVLHSNCGQPEPAGSD